MNQDQLYKIIQCLSPQEKKELSSKFESEKKSGKSVPK